MSTSDAVQLYCDETVFAVGTCSLCGGRVVKAKIVGLSQENNFTEPPAMCQQCGARERKDNFGPVIPMVK